MEAVGTQLEPDPVIGFGVMPATYLSHPTIAPGLAPAADSWSFDESQQILLLRGAVARHLTGRSSCRLRLDDFLARLSDGGERECCRLLHGQPPFQPVELKLSDPSGQTATFGFTVAVTGRRRRGLVRPPDIPLGLTGAARRTALERLIGAVELCRTGAVLLLLRVEEWGLIGGLEL